MQSVSSRIWTHVAVSISYDDNHYTTGTSTSGTSKQRTLQITTSTVVSSMSYLELSILEKNTWNRIIVFKQTIRIT